jgi:hypothetical protein
LDDDLVKMPRLGQMVIYLPKPSWGARCCPAVVTDVLTKTEVHLQVFPPDGDVFRVYSASRARDSGGELTNDKSLMTYGTWIFG